MDAGMRARLSGTRGVGDGVAGSPADRMINMIHNGVGVRVGRVPNVFDVHDRHLTDTRISCMRTN